MRHQGEQASKHSRVANRTTGINAQTHAADPGLGHRPNKNRGNPRHPEPPAANLRTGPRLLSPMPEHAAGSGDRGGPPCWLRLVAVRMSRVMYPTVQGCPRTHPGNS